MDWSGPVLNLELKTGWIGPKDRFRPWFLQDHNISNQKTILSRVVATFNTDKNTAQPRLSKINPN
ncbi:5525_t:CDS:2 [Gigaspora rosea]|nr:5525_t:CDS:2 [Gigaspora rosea]